VIDKNEIEKEVSQDQPASKPISNDDKIKFSEKIKINIPVEERQTYIKHLLKHFNAFSQDKNEIGLATNLKHRIDLKNKEPTYRKKKPFRKQFLIPDAQRGELETQVKEWLKMGLIHPRRSRYNSPFFMALK
jgi:hypothetical protein